MTSFAFSGFVSPNSSHGCAWIFAEERRFKWGTHSRTHTHPGHRKYVRMAGI